MAPWLSTAPPLTRSPEGQRPEFGDGNSGTFLLGPNSRDSPRVLPGRGVPEVQMNEERPRVPSPSSARLLPWTERAIELGPPASDQQQRSLLALLHGVAELRGGRDRLLRHFQDDVELLEARLVCGAARLDVGHHHALRVAVHAQLARDLGCEGLYGEPIRAGGLGLLA